MYTELVWTMETWLLYVMVPFTALEMSRRSSRSSVVMRYVYAPNAYHAMYSILCSQKIWWFDDPFPLTCNSAKILCTGTYMYMCGHCY